MKFANLLNASSIGLMLLGAAALAQDINFDAPGGLGGVNYSGTGASSDSGVYWNPMVKGGTTTANLLSDGATTSPVTLSDTSPSSYNPGQGTQGTVAALEAPFAYENSGATVTESLNNVPVGTYNLFLYGKNSNDSGNGDRGTTFTVSVGATGYGTQSTVNGITSAFTRGNDYVTFSNVVLAATGKIMFTYTANGAATGTHNPQTEGDFNGLQLQAITPFVSIHPTSIFASIGGSTQLVATVSGATPQSYQWQRGTNGIFVNNADAGDISGSQSNILTFSDVAIADTGGYRLIATNLYGAATSQVATVTVSLAPVITLQPASADLVFGQSAQLTAAAAGQTPLVYQWQKGTNGAYVNIGDAGDITGSTTNTLAFGSAVPADAGDYQLIVTNASGSITSQVAAVTVSYSAPVGSSTPWTEIEAENGTLGGGATIVSLVPPLSNPTNSLYILEASGAAYVVLTNTGQSVSWVNHSGQSVTALNLRYSIPDAPGGYGLTNTLDLYVNGLFREAIPVNSKQIYVYGADPTDKNPADGGAFVLWDEYHCFITGAPIAPGSTITLQKDSTNTAAFYYVDLIDLEAPPAPLPQPTNSLSITSYGAVSNSPATDNTTAIQSCINAAQTSGKIVWIPAGEFYFGSSSHSGLSATGVTIAGAGLWYSELYNNPTTPGSGGPFFNNLVSCTLQNVDLDCNANDADSPGAMDVSGTNWVVNSVWASHLGVGCWAAGNNGAIENMRVNNTWGDGININNFTGASTTGNNLIISNNFVRFVDNDGIAVNGTDNSPHTPMSGITIVRNTIDEAAGRLVIYGGNNIVIQGNYTHDLVQNDGIQVGYFQQTGTVTNVLVANNLVVRCGNSIYQSPGILVGTQFTNYVNNSTNVGYFDTGVTVVGNTISQPYYGGIQIQVCGNVDLENNVIGAPALYGIETTSFSVGSATINNNVVSSLPPGQPMFYNNSSAYPVSTTNSMVRAPIEAASYNNVSSATAFRETCLEGGEDLCNLQGGDCLVYSNLDLNGINTLAARVACTNLGTGIEIHLDSPSGPLAGICAVVPTGGGQTWATVNCAIGNASGYHNAYLVFTGGTGSLLSLEWFAWLGAGNGIEAASDNGGSGIQTENCVEGGLDLTNITSGSYAVYNQMNLAGAVSFNARVASGGAGGSIQIRLDATNGTLIGTCPVTATGGWQTWTTVTCALNNAASGYHNVCLVFTGGAGDLFNLERWQFQFNSANAVLGDLALNRPVTASSVDGYPAANAVDGNLNTRWSSAYSDPQSIYVDLGSVFNITGVTLVWESAYGTAYQIQVSTNASTWTTIYSTVNGQGGTETLSGLSGTGRYVRMYGTQRATQYGYSLWEFEVFGNTPQPTAGPQTSLPLALQSASPSQGFSLQWPDNGNREQASQPTAYQAAALTPPVVWTPVAGSPTYYNGQWLLNLPPGTNSQGFFELQ